MSAERVTQPSEPVDEEKSSVSSGEIAGVQASASAGSMSTVRAGALLGVQATASAGTPEKDVPISGVFTDWAVPFQSRRRGAFGGGTFNSTAFNTAGYNESSFQFAEAVRADAALVDEAVQAIARAIAPRPRLVVATSRALAEEFARAAREREHTKPNEPNDLAKYEELVLFLNSTSRGFSELADTLDNGMKGRDNDIEPVLLGKAAEIAHRLQTASLNWLADNHSLVFDGAFRLGVFGLGMLFLGMIGVEQNTAAIAAVGTIAATAKGPRKEP